MDVMQAISYQKKTTCTFCSRIERIINDHLYETLFCTCTKFYNKTKNWQNFPSKYIMNCLAF